MNYTYLKLLHIIAVIVFLGNIFTGLFWMKWAVKSKDLKIINHTINGIIRSDKFFTIPGVLVITLFGIMAAIYGHFPILGTPWILWSIICFSLSGLAFSFKVAPLQKKLSKITAPSLANSDFDWAKFHLTYLAWDVWGLIALILPIAALVMMVLKIPGN